jgi:fructose-1,6-bisphosphatase II / sedoheptulose-1,7-bisphosphatase
MAKGDVMFAATGVTDGSMLSGIRRAGYNKSLSHSVVMRSKTGTVRYIHAEHYFDKKDSVD